MSGRGCARLRTWRTCFLAPGVSGAVACFGDAVMALIPRLCCFNQSDWTQPVITVKAWLATVSIYGGESDIERLARRGEMYFESPVAVRQFKRLLQKTSDRFANGRGLIVREKAVAVELDENPIRSPVNANAGSLPASQTFDCGGITGR